MSIDTTDSLTPIDLSTPILVSPTGGDPTPLPETRAADGTRKLKSLPPPIPTRASTSDLIAQPRTTTAELAAPIGGAPGLAAGTATKLRAAPRASLPPPIPSAARTQASTTPAVARTKSPLPTPNRAKGTVPPPVPARPLTADPDGWSVSAPADDQTPLPPPQPADEELRDILAPDPEGPEVTRPTPFIEPAATAPLDAAPSPAWLAKIDSVLRPESPPQFTAAPTGLPTTKAAVELFATKAEAPVMTQPLELVDLEPVPAPAPKPAHPVAAVAAAIGAAPAPVARAPLPVVPAPVASAPALPPAAAIVSLPAHESFDVDFEADMTSAHTTNFEMPAKRRMLSPMIAIGMFAVAAVGTAGYLATRGGHTHKIAAPAARDTAKAEAPAPTPAPAAAPAPAAVTPAAAPAASDTAQPAPTAQAIAAAAPATQEVAAAPAPGDSTMLRMPVTSKPSGALVTFVDGGHAVVVGRTPTTIAFDPRQPHDVALTLLDHETQLVTIPTGGMTALVVDMGEAKTGGASPTVPHVASDVTATRPETPAPKHHTPARSEAPAPAATMTKAAPRAPAQKIAQPAPHMAETAVPAGAGVLMISSKPPCEIVVDGKSTHLTTPQRQLPLAAGTHTIVLVNAQAKIHKTLAISIAPKKSTKVIQDFTKH